MRCKMTCYEPCRDSYLPERRCQTVYADNYPCYSSNLGYSSVYNTYSYSRPCRYRQRAPLDPLSSCVNVAIFATLAFGAMTSLINRY